MNVDEPVVQPCGSEHWMLPGELGVQIHQAFYLRLYLLRWDVFQQSPILTSHVVWKGLSLAVMQFSLYLATKDISCLVRPLMLRDGYVKLLDEIGAQVAALPHD